MVEPLNIPRTSILIQVADNGYFAQVSGDAVKFCSRVFAEKAALFLWLARNIPFRGERGPAQPGPQERHPGLARGIGEHWRLVRFWPSSA
ncbi:MAG: hypothetical protein ACYC6G_18385 [Desulfobaccales bacterium]